MGRLITLALVGVVATCLLGCERAKTRMDREVDRLCAIDGGVHVYETVKLPKENFGPDGEVFPQFKSLRGDRGRYGLEYADVIRTEIIQAGDPSIGRKRLQIVRRADGKVLGEVIDYQRSGGDLSGPWEPSTHTCNLGSSAVGFERRIFVIEQE